MWDFLWKGLAWWEKRQFKIGISLVVIFLIWIAYDVGVAVTSSQIPVLNGPISGQWHVTDLSHYLDHEKGGLLRLDTDNVARFQSSEGKIYLMPYFGDEINEKVLEQIEKSNVQVDGHIKIETMASRHSDALIYILLDIGTKSMLLVFYGLMAVLLFKYWKGGALLGPQKFRHITRTSSEKVHFSDVAGQEGPKREITEVVDYLKNPEPFKRVGAKPIKGVLLYGPPGNGKTMLAKAVAGEANADFIEQSASTFMELYVGAGAKAVRQLFDEARKHAPCVIFIDEIDAMGSSRSKAQHTEYNQTLLALLTEMDGFGSNEGIVVMAATNRVEDLDEALVRPGRFDRKVRIPLPGRLDRLAILKQHAQALPSVNVSLEKWADQTPGFSGAELAALVNEAAYEAASRQQEIITDEAFALARDKIMLGVRDKGRRPSAKDLKIIALHELGHAVARLSFGQKIEKISVEPRGMSLGATVVQFEEGYDRLLQTQEEIHQDLVVLMGGRAAEEVFLGKVTGGAADDMEKASNMAREVIRRFGFSPDGHHVSYIPEHSELLKDIEAKAGQWVQKAYDEAKEMVQAHKEGIASAVEPLLLNESIDGKTLEKILSSTFTPKKEKYVFSTI